MADKCKCDFCETYDQYRWAVITECKCGCHTMEGIIGHDGLCCEFPNGKEKDSPYVSLFPSMAYKQELYDMEREEQQQ